MMKWEIKVVVWEDGSEGYYAVDGDYETEIYYRKKDLLKDLVKKTASWMPRDIAED